MRLMVAAGFSLRNYHQKYLRRLKPAATGRSMKPAIRAEHVSKFYAVGAAPTGGRNLTETLRHSVGKAYSKVRALLNPGALGDHGFWAVRDVSFEVQPGEAV